MEEIRQENLSLVIHCHTLDCPNLLKYGSDYTVDVEMQRTPDTLLARFYCAICTEKQDKGRATSLPRYRLPVLPSLFPSNAIVAAVTIAPGLLLLRHIYAASESGTASRLRAFIFINTSGERYFRRADATVEIVDEMPRVAIDNYTGIALMSGSYQVIGATSLLTPAEETDKKDKVKGDK